MYGTSCGGGHRRSIQPKSSASSTCLGWALLTGLLIVGPSHAQQAVQFFPDDVPATAANITQRLIFRSAGLQQVWDEGYVTTVRLQERIVLTPENWQQAFAATGGTAVLSPLHANGGVLRITSGLNDTLEGQQYTRHWLDFSSMPGAILVEGGARLLFDNVGLAGIAPTYAYKYSVYQPHRNAGVGYPLWPTILLAPNATVSVRNVSVNFVNPSSSDTPEQYTAKVVFGMRQQYGSNSITEVNSTAATVVGPLTISVLVLNGSTNSTVSNDTAGKGNQSALAYAYFRNVTFNCEPRPTASTTSGLSGAALAAAIAVPVVVAMLLLAGLAAWACRRRRKPQRPVQDPKVARDMEAGSMQLLQHDADLCNASDQQQLRDAAAGVVHVPAGAVAGTMHGSAGSSTGEGGSGSTDHTSISAATPAGAKTPFNISSLQRAAVHSSSAESNEPDFSRTGAAQDPTYGVEEPATASAGLAAAAAAAAAFRPAAAISPASSRQLWQTTMTTSHSGSGSAAVCLRDTSSYDTGVLERGSTGRLASEDGPLARTSQHTPPLSVRSSLEAGGTHGATAGSARSSVEHPAIIAAVSRAGSGGRHSGSSAIATERSGSGSITRAGDTASGSAMGTGTTSSRVLDRQVGMSALLKARSELAVLRDLKIGPLLGRGSYGRVYKGRWKAVTVAVKIIEHSEGSPGTASSGANCISVGRETFVATNISHPNVVQTYHISTMTISQRNTLASTWLKEAAGNTSSNRKAHLEAAVASRQMVEDDDTAVIESSDSSQSSQSSGDGQPEILETWMLLEFCEKGSLHKAIQQGKFISRGQQQPDMIGIYKALLDTASGLDYLHSIGVVHGDLKTANVLLKGSARDVRGFACKIADFGLSRVLDMDATHISTRTYGTIVYMPSELLLTGRMTTSTDIYSFGLMMWELFTSQPVFEEGLSVGQIFYMIAYQNWRPTVPTDCPSGYAQLMTACWHQDPELRPTVQQLLRGLQRLYVAEKQRVMAAKQVSTAAAALGASRNGTATSNRPGTAGGPSATVQQMPADQLVQPTVALQAIGPAAALAAVPPVAQQAAASAALAMAAFAAEESPAAPISTGAGLQSQDLSAANAAKAGATVGDRTSFESTSSDRYANAAAASEGSLAVTGLPQWSYPGQLTPTSAAASPATGTTADASPVTGTSQDSALSSSANTPVTPAAAGVQPAGAMPITSETSLPAAATLGPADASIGTHDTYQPNRQSFSSSRSSAGAAPGSEGAARSSGGASGGQDEYQAWANAVSREGLVSAGSRMLATRQRSAPLPGHWMGRQPFTADHQQTQQQQENRRQQDELQLPALQQQSTGTQGEQGQQQEQQQESRLGTLLHQALGAQSTPFVAVGAQGPLHFTSELYPIDDNEPIVDTIPSESLFPPATMSSSSNAVFGNPEEFTGHEYEDTSGFLAAMRYAPGHAHHHHHQHRAAHGPVGPAAQHFVQALDMVASHGTGSESYYQPMAEAPQHMPYAGTAAGQTSHKMQGSTSAGGTVPPGAAGSAGTNLNTLPSDSIGGWASGVTTGTLPSVLGDDGSTAASSGALRSSGGTVGHMSRLGTQESNWQPSSSSSGERTPLAVFPPLMGYGYGAGHSTVCQIAGSPSSPARRPSTAVTSNSNIAASLFAQAAVAAVAPPTPSASAAASYSPHAAAAATAAPAACGASPFAQAAAAAAAAVPVGSRPGLPFEQAAVAVTHAAPVPPATPASIGRFPFALAGSFAPLVPAVPAHIHSSGSSGHGTAGSSSGNSTPERQRTPPREAKFVYRTPSGRIILQSRSTGTLQTVREGSGPESKTSSADSRAGSGTAASKTDSSGTGGSRAASLYPAASQDYVLRQRNGQQSFASQHQPADRDGDGHVPQPTPGGELSTGAGAPLPSPFAALAQRAGSLFGPG